VHNNTRVEVVVADITTFPVACIVNAANVGLRGGGGVDGAIHDAAGTNLLKALQATYINGGKESGAYLTKAYAIYTADWIVHTVGPDLSSGKRDARKVKPNVALERAYRNTLEEAEGFTSIAFPTISTGIFAFPKEEACLIALRTVKKYLDEHKGFMRVVFLVYDPKTKGPSEDAIYYNKHFPSFATL